mgnify:FL=1
MTERHAQTRIWIQIMHNLRGYLDNIKDNTEWAKLKSLKFHAIWSLLASFGQRGVVSF